MLFIDEEVQAKFHKLPALLQVVCQILEGILSEHLVQLEVIECEKKFGMSIVMLGASCEEAVLKDAADQVNARFPRKDKKSTCVIESEENGIMTIRVSNLEDLSQVQ